MPEWLHLLSIASLIVAVGCALAIVLHFRKARQKMAVMYAVWPLAALFGSLPLLGFYLRYGTPRENDAPPHAVSVAKGSLHCGSGCTLGDLLAETFLTLLPSAATWFGWHWLFRQRLFAAWTLDFLLAFAIGIVFQYFAIAPMRGLSWRDGIKAALKADTLSLIAWQAGMYGVMAIWQWLLFPHLGGAVDARQPEFWFAMQWAMLGGFVTSYPVNAWLLRRGIKEAM